MNSYTTRHNQSALVRAPRLAAALLAVASAAAPQRGDSAIDVTANSLASSGYSVDRHVIASGGGTSSSGTFAITGSIGQHDADPLQPSTGGTYSLSGGFAGDSSQDRIFANGFEG